MNVSAIPSCCLLQTRVTTLPYIPEFSMKGGNYRNQIISDTSRFIQDQDIKLVEGFFKPNI
jgi:hypothetical protein